MAFTYLILNLVFLLAVIILFRKDIKKPTKTWWLMLAALLLLTAIFDNLMIYLGIFGYETSKTLSIYIGLAPIEDFFYAILAAILVPILWRRLKKPSAPSTQKDEKENN